MTSKDLIYKRSVAEQAKFGYSPLSEALVKKLGTKKSYILFKTNYADLTYNSNHSFSKYKEVNKFKQLSLDSVEKMLQNLYDQFNKLKKLQPKTNKKKKKMAKIFDKITDFPNKHFDIYKENYNEEKESLTA